VQGSGDPGASFRLATALQASGGQAEARALLAAVLASPTPFPERAAATRLAGELR